MTGSASRSTRAPEYGFEPLREEALPLVERWLLEPHVRRWWDDDPSKDYPREKIEKYRAAIRGAGEPTDRFLIRLERRPIGMIQAYRIAAYPEYAAALALDEPAVGIDLFIGEPELLGGGHGPALLRRFLTAVVFAQYDLPLCVIAPSVENVAAIRAYEKAGFRHLRDAHVPGEADPEHVMFARREDLGLAAPLRSPP